ncbi:GDP-L-fucose synthase-like [Macrobrachium nipponense]|uniref:GDP-L-fucose synthase-like n=1 Tax=Macrobrachium nipponense TaxID=159736 RepID=UPI0030C7E396
MEEKMTVLVTGGSGMLGYALQKVIKEKKRPGEEWIFIGSKDADLREIDETRTIFEKHMPTHVIHLAAIVGGVFKNMKNTCDILLTNQKINLNVYQVCKEIKVKKLISCLSTCVYPDKITYPITESMLHDGPPHPSNFGYSFAKRSIDAMNKCYRWQYGCPFVSVIPTSIYGPNDIFSVEDAHVIPGLINKVRMCKRANTPLVVWGTGKPLRQFIFSYDLAQLVIWAIREYDEEDNIFLSVDEKDEISIRELVEVIVEEYGFKGEVVFDDTKTDGQYKKTVSTAKLRKYLPDFKFTPIREGIRETIRWFEDNYDIART